MQHRRSFQGMTVVAAMVAVVLPFASRAGEVIVHVAGIADDAGTIVCALFPERLRAGFPLKGDKVESIRVAPRVGAVTCSFAGVAGGTYAVSVMNDRNGNGRMDTNLLGVPTEPWGVSNNVRPALRAPRFEEAAFQVPDDKARSIDVTLGR